MSVVELASPREIATVALSVFQSIGVSSSNLVILSLADYDDKGDLVKGTGEPVPGRGKKNVSIDELIRRVPSTIALCDSRQESVLLAHPKGEGITTFQLDDIPEDRLRLIQHIAFIVIQTSPGSFQAWLAWKSQAGDTEFKSRVKKIVADKNATGSVRIPGSRNFKLPYLRKYGAFPLIEITHVALGRLTSREELAEAIGIPVSVELPAAVARPAATERPSRVAHSVRLVESSTGTATGDRWPSYQMCLAGSYSDGKEQRHTADFTWCLRSFQWGQGYSVGDVANRLMMESTKAQERGSAYATETAQNAFRAARREPDFEERWNRFVRPRAPKGEREPSPCPVTAPARSTRPDGPLRSSDGYSQIAPAPARPAAPETPFDSISAPRPPKAKIIVLTESEEDALAIESASGITTVALTRGIPADLRVRCGLGKVLLATGDKLARHLGEILWGKMVRVRLPEGIRRVSDMDTEELRALILELAPEIASSPEPVAETATAQQSQAVTDALEAVTSVSTPAVPAEPKSPVSLPPANPWHGVYGEFGEHATIDMVERTKQISYGVGFVDDEQMRRFEN